MAEKALDIRKDLAAELPEIFLPALALSFHNLGLLLHEVGRDEEALTATQEGARLRRQLTAANPEAFIARNGASHFGWHLENLFNKSYGWYVTVSCGRFAAVAFSPA